MSPIVLVAGVDSRGLPLEAPLLRRERIPIEEVADARSLVERAADVDVRVVVLGGAVEDATAAEVVRRLRGFPDTRHVSILVLLPATSPADLDRDCASAGANGVMRRPLDGAELEGWLAKLLAVPRRVQARIPVQAQVVGTARSTGMSFVGMLRNVSVNGLLLESPLGLEIGRDLELEFPLPGRPSPPVRVLGRVVRRADEVAWPHIGFGIEFLLVSDDALVALTEYVAANTPRPEDDTAAAGGDEELGIHATVRRELWVYEIAVPVPRRGVWQVEIRRAARESWRPGSSGPFYVVEGNTPEHALREAREFVKRTPER
jgi:CheY-like chemotaxis protein